MYCGKSAEETARILQTDLTVGLTEEQVRERRARYGENRLKTGKKKGIPGLFLEQLNDPLIYILMAAIAISLFLGEAKDAGIIATVVMLNAIVGVIQEGKARRAIEALQKLTSPRALVRRQGREQEIASEQLVPGDLVYLEAGRQVPADLRLFRTANLKVEEAALTGESVPSEKNPDCMTEAAGGPGDAHNMAFMTTMVTYGRGEGIVTATGMDTEIGRIAGMIEEKGGEMTPLQKRLADLGRVLSAAAVLLCICLFLLAIWQHRDVGDMLLTAISLAVAAVPEGLPAVVTIVLALSVSRMVRVNTIVRRLPSVETLGAVNVICSDKTGTLTQNRMTVRSCYGDGQCFPVEKLDPDRHRFLLEGCTLCNDASFTEGEWIGDPTELALLALGRSCGLEKPRLEMDSPRIDELPFDSQRKRMTTIHRRGKERIAFTKGAADELVELCTTQWLHGQEVPFGAKARRAARAAAAGMGKEALRVLAVAMKRKGDLTREEDLVFLGLLGMMDPPREEAISAVESFKRAHVDTVMITGDHRETALAIAEMLKITEPGEEACLTGAQIDAMSHAQFEEAAEHTRIYARVSPLHKVRIVEALKKQGKVVAMTGDGINDAPSLKAADVGIAMGKGGTDVARNAADLVLTDDNFATIEKAMREGRGIYENIRKTVLFLLSSNFGEIITMLAAILVGLPAPLKASHILWVNLITDSLPALALGVDVNDSDGLMKEPPRKSTESMFARGGLACTLCYGLVIGLISLTAFLAVPYLELLGNGFPVNAENLRKMLGVQSVLFKAQTHAFTVLGMSQLVHAIGMRDVNRSVFKMKHRENPYLLLALGTGIFLQMLVTEIPYFLNLFDTSRLSLYEWGRLWLLACTPLLVHELLMLVHFLTEKNEENVSKLENEESVSKPENEESVSKQIKEENVSKQAAESQ